jgi:hypothetical protein
MVAVERLYELPGRGVLHLKVTFCVRFCLITRSLMDGKRG